MSNEFYLRNPLVHRDRRLGRRHTPWVNQFDCTHIRPLIICRGPIRKEAMDVFSEMGITHFGILLSEKDSIVYQSALAPELRSLNDPDRVHRVPDYTGANKEERDQRIQRPVTACDATVKCLHADDRDDDLLVHAVLLCGSFYQFTVFQPEIDALVDALVG